MSRGYRDIIAPAIGVSIAGAALAWALYPEQPELSGNAAYQEQQPGYRAGGSDCLPAEIAELRGRQRARRAVACQEAEEQHRLAANDLIQQRRAADAADASAVLTYQQTRIAAWGVFLGFVTMAAAIAAAWFARRAAVATEETVGIAREASSGAADALVIAERNADAAADAAKWSRDAVSAGRAWICPERLENGRIKRSTINNGEYIDDGIIFKVLWGNFGQSPAIEVTVYVDFAVLPINSEVPCFYDHLGSEGRRKSVVGPGKFSTTSLVFLNDEQTQAFQNRQAKVFVYSTISYFDVISGDIIRTSEVCYEAVHQRGTETIGGEKSEAIGIQTIGPQNRLT